MRWVVATSWAALAIGLAMPAQAETPPVVARALEQARNADRPLLINLTASWCSPCRYHETRIAPDPVVRELLAQFEVLVVDYDQDEGAAVVSAYGTSGVPVFLVLDEVGTIVARLNGTGGDAAGFAEFLRRALRATADRLAMLDRLAAGPDDPRALLEAARWHAEHALPAPALAYYTRAIEADGEDARGVASVARWERGELERAERYLEDAIGDAVAHLRAYPAGHGSSTALSLAVHAGRLDPREIRELLRRHIEATTDEKRLHLAAYEALSARAFDLALTAAERMPPASLRTIYLRAEILLHMREPDQARAAARQGQALSTNERERQSFRELLARIDDGDLQSRGLDAVRQQAERYLAHVRNPGQAYQPEPDRDRAGEFDRMLRFMTGARAALERAGSRCSSYAGALPEAYVRLVLPPGGGVPQQVDVLEPGASLGLKRCLRLRLHLARLPAPPLHLEGRYVDRVVFPASNLEPAVPRPGRRWTDQVYLYVHGARGLGDSIGVGSRGLVPLLPVGDTDLEAWLGWQGHAGQSSSNDGSYEVTVTAALAASHGPASFGLGLGLGVSQNGEPLPRAVGVPFEMFVAISGERLRGLFWVRSTWLAGDGPRKQGAGDALFFSDELTLGAGLRLPARTENGFFVGLSHQQAMDSGMWSIYAGTSLDSIIH